MYYFLLANILLVVILGIRSSCVGHRLILYLQEHYHEREKEFGWYGYKSANALYKKHDIDDDSEFFQLKTRARKATTLTIVAMLPMSLLVILLLIIAVFFGG
jgi:uncharacterized membrane protein